MSFLYVIYLQKHHKRSAPTKKSRDWKLRSNQEMHKFLRVSAQHLYVSTIAVLELTKPANIDFDMKKLIVFSCLLFFHSGSIWQ